MTSTAPAVHLRSGLRAAGYSDDEVRQRVRAGELGVVRRGAYVDGALPDDHGARSRVMTSGCDPRLIGAAISRAIQGATSERDGFGHPSSVRGARRRRP